MRLIIDAGHGGTDSGAKAFGYLEKDLNLIIAKRLQEILKHHVTCDLTRDKDMTLDPTPRTVKVKNMYDYCLSIHFNAFNGTARGIEAIHSIFSTKGKALAEKIVESLHRETGNPVRRVFSKKSEKAEQDYYFMHRLTGSTCTVIVECCFLDNKDDIKALNIETMAQAIAKGFLNHIK